MVQRLEEGNEARRLGLRRWVIANRRLIPFILLSCDIPVVLEIMRWGRLWSQYTTSSVVVTKSIAKTTPNPFTP